MNLHTRKNQSDEDRKFLSLVKEGSLEEARLLAWHWRMQFPHSSPVGRKWHDRYEACCQAEETYVFDLDGERNRTRKEWSLSGKASAVANARNYAKQHGSAGMWNADSSVTIYTAEGNRVTQKTHKRAVPAQLRNRRA